MVSQRTAASNLSSFARSALDVLSAHVAILDATGTIIAVNKAWRDFAHANPPVSPRVFEGTNYLTVCENATGKNSKEAAAFATGIRAVMTGEIEHFALEYPCHASFEKRWFIGRVTCFHEKGQPYVVVAHENITTRKQAENKLRKAYRGLAKQVAARTADLLNTTRALQAEITERHRLQQEQEILYQLTHELARISDADTVGERLFARTQQFFNADYGDLMLLSEAGNMELRGIAAYGVGAENFPQERIDVSTEPSVVALAVQKREAVVITDYAQNPLVSERLQKTYSFLRDAWSVPLMNGETLVGVFSVAYLNPQEASAEKLRFLQLLGNEAALAIARIQLAEKLRRSERLAAIGFTTAKLTHEIGNPLNGMYTTVQLLERRLAKQADSEETTLHETVHDLRGEVNRLRSLLDEFRTFSRSQHLTRAPVDLATLVAEVLAVEAPYYTERHIHIEQHFPPDLPPVRVDEEKLKQVLLNLCNNATEAMPAGGKLTVRGYHSQEQVTLEVRDTGAGVPADVDIFEPFTTTKTEGTGLGLPIVQQIVTAHGGTLSYTSKQGEGTAFYVTLPLRN